MISVCMATYNGARFINRQIDSILLQLKDDDELIVSDDGSTDNTLEILDTYNDSRIKVLHHISNSTFIPHEKVTANFENALSVAKGDYIFLSDQDDEWLPNKVSICMEFFKNYDFIVHKKNNFSDYSNDIINVDEDIKLPKNWIQHIFHMKLFGCCMAFKKDLLQNALPFPFKLIGHDYWISAIAIRFYNCKVVNTPLINYRLHNDSVSQGKKKSIMYKIVYRLRLFLQIKTRIYKIIHKKERTAR